MVLFTTKKSNAVKWSLFLLTFLGVTDMILRGSKGAFIYILIQIFIVLYLRNTHIGIKFNYKIFIIIKKPV